MGVFMYVCIYIYILNEVIFKNNRINKFEF